MLIDEITFACPACGNQFSIDVDITQHPFITDVHIVCHRCGSETELCGASAKQIQESLENLQTKIKRSAKS